MKGDLKIFLLAFFLGFAFWLGVNILEENFEEAFYAQISQPFKEIVFVKVPERPKLNLNVKAALAVKIDKFGKEKILFKKNINQPLPIASLTKLMTATVLLEDQNYDLEKFVPISKEAASQENVPVYGNLDREVGKSFKVKDLLNLMLIYSSNDAAWALAEVIGVPNFVKKMNEKAKSLGLENTHFVNPHGLDPKNPHLKDLKYFNYSTPKDLAKLSQYILKKHPLIFKISIQKKRYLTKDGIFDLFLPSENGKIIGGKTGYTKKAGGCIIFLFQDKKGNNFINIILGAPSSSARIEEMQKLINWLIL